MDMCVYWLYIVLINILLALAIFVRSPAAYEALKDFGILGFCSYRVAPPCSLMLVRFFGASSVCLVDQVAQYVLFKEKMKTDGKLEPRSDGILVFDEVKVVSRLIWNSKNQRLIGLAMTSNDLHDIYQLR